MNKVLIDGFQKTGTTWVRFILFNYFHVIENGLNVDTLTYKELEAKTIMLESGKNEDIMFTHLAADGQAIFQKYDVDFTQFDKLIYIYRNPYDVMISYWHWAMDREVPWNGAFPKEELEKMKKLFYFTKIMLPMYKHHVRATRHLSDFVLNYDIMRSNPNLASIIIEFLGMKLDLKVFKRALELSSFDNIHELKEQPFKQIYRGNFCRDGRSGQYRDVMNKILIKYINERWIK